MSQYLWEETVESYFNFPIKKIPVQRQEYLISLYKEVSKEIKMILDTGLTFPKIEEIIKREEVLNLILLSFAVDEDIVAYSPHSIFFELEDAYISGIIEPAFPFDSKTLISQI